jgi:hypothetical protein
MTNASDEHRYDDIINLPHHESTTHPHMSLKDRAAQFGAFEALNGHKEAMEETARLAEDRMNSSHPKTKP